MTLSNDEFAALALGLGLGLGVGVGTGATLISPAFGIGMGAGMVAILYATQQKRNGEPEDVDERRVLYCTCITCKETETLLLEVDEALAIDGVDDDE